MCYDDEYDKVISYILDWNGAGIFFKGRNIPANNEFKSGKTDFFFVQTVQTEFPENDNQ